VLIKNCNVVDCVGNVRRGAWVLIEGNRIARVGEEPEPTGDGVDSIDAGGGYLLPGLMNLHVHINRRHLSRGAGAFRQGAPGVENSDDGTRMLYAARNAWYELSRGVTTIRDLCSVGRTASVLKNAIVSGLIRGPRMVVCGLGIAATGGHETHRYKGAVEVDGPSEVMKAVRYEVKQGADFIKLMVSGGLGGMPEHEHPSWTEFSLDEIKAAVYAAHSHNRGVTVHAMGEGPVMNALLGGVDGIEHGAVLSDEALDLMKDRGVYYVPTMSGITAVADKEARSGGPELAATMRELVVNPQRESVARAHECGILIGAGSDTLGSVVDELLLMKECGMTAYDALKTATVNAARILDRDDEFGTVEEGKIADLVIVGGDPLADLNNLRDVRKVILGGEVVTETWMCNLQ
jgi:imidazolonepropionase-like amidohydrolase